MTLHQFLLALRGRFWVFLTLVVATFAAAIVVTFLMPRTYEATVSVLVDVKDEQMLNTPTGSPRAQLGYMQTQIDIIQSQRTARRAVEILKLDQNPRLKAAFEEKGGQGSFQDWIADGLLADLKVDSSQSSVIMMKYASNNAKFAADVANAFAQAYVDTALKLRTEPTAAAATWFEEQLKDLRKAFESAQAKLQAFQAEKGILIADERLDIEMQRLSELSQQSLRAADEAYGAGARLGQARSRASDTVPEVIANPLVSSLRGELLRAEARLQEASTRLGPNHPEYKQKQAEVSALRDRVNSESKKVVGGVESSSAQSYARQGALQKDLAEQRKKVEALRDARSQSMVLVRDVETAQKAYEAALARFLVNKVESGAKQTNVTVLNAASVPALPAKPRVPVNIAVGLIVGILLGLAAVFFLELLDRRVRSTEDLEIGLDAPLLGTLQPWQPARLLGGPGDAKALPSPA